MIKIRPVAAALACALALPFAAPAFAQGAWPTKSVRFVVAFPPGGPTDLLARLIGQKLTDQVSQPIVVENVVGATGTIAHGQVARAAPDGYTILMASTSSHVAAYLYRKMPYDPLKDLVPVINVATLPMALFVHPSVPAANLQEFLQLARTKPDSLNYASPGSGSAGHLVTERFLRLVDIKVTHIPFKGAGPASAASIAGQTQVLFDTISTSYPHVKSGKLRALGVASPKRSPAAPDIPTMDEGGVKGFEGSLWFAVFAPAGTPQAILDRLNGEITKAMGAPDIQARIAVTGGEFVPNTQAQWAQAIRPDTDNWVKVIRETGATVD